MVRIPAEHKYATRAVIAEVITPTIRWLNLKFPESTDGKQEQLAEARRHPTGES